MPEDSRVFRARRLCTQPPIASKPGSSPPERPGPDNTTSQPWYDATCPCTTSWSAYFRFVTFFLLKKTRQSTRSGVTFETLSLFLLFFLGFEYPTWKIMLFIGKPMGRSIMISNTQLIHWTKLLHPFLVRHPRPLGRIPFPFLPSPLPSFLHLLLIHLLSSRLFLFHPPPSHPCPRFLRHFTPFFFTFVKSHNVLSHVLS